MSDIQYEYNEKNGIIFDDLEIHPFIAKYVRHLFINQDYALTIGRAFTALETFIKVNYIEDKLYKNSILKIKITFPKNIKKIYKGLVTKKGLVTTEIEKLENDFNEIKNKRHRIHHKVTVTFNIDACISYLKQIYVLYNALI